MLINNLIAKINKNKSLFSDLFFNIILILTYIFFANYLEEDLMIGFSSNLILCLIIFMFREFKSENIRQYRKKIKKVFRVQRDLLKRYYFFFYKLLKINFKYIKNLTVKKVFIKSIKLYLKLYFKIKFFFSKFIYLKIYYLNILTLFSFKLSLKIFRLFQK